MLLQMMLTTLERMQYAKAVSENCRRLTSLITNILRLNKLENQQIFPTVAPYDLGEQLRECVLAFENEWESKNITLEADIADGIMTTTDGEFLSLVWNNLLSNAIKFTANGGRVTVSLRDEVNIKPDTHTAIVKICDTGCGMDEKTKEHIFEKFFQGDTPRSKRQRIRSCPCRACYCHFWWRN